MAYFSLGIAFDQNGDEQVQSDVVAQVNDQENDKVENNEEVKE